MLFSDRNWMLVEEYLKSDDRVILVLGATEQHAYLSLLTDSKIPLAMAEAAAEKTGVLIAPPLHFGCSPFFLAYPGTINLRSTTLMAVVEDIVRSLYGSGFRRFLLVRKLCVKSDAGLFRLETLVDHFLKTGKSSARDKKDIARIQYISFSILVSALVFKTHAGTLNQLQ